MHFPSIYILFYPFVLKIVLGIERVYVCESDGENIAYDNICNGRTDCSDGSDEKFCVGGNDSYVGKWHRVIRTVQRSLSVKRVYDQRRILSPEECLCRTNGSRDPRDCLIMDDVSHILSNGRKDCHLGQDEIPDLKMLADILKEEDIFHIFQFVENSKSKCSGRNCELKEFPSHITRNKCPDKIYSYCHSSLSCLKNSYPCRINGYYVCHGKAVFDEILRRCFTAFDPLDSNGCPGNTWSCPESKNVNAKKRCTTNVCTVPFNCKERKTSVTIAVNTKNHMQSSFYMRLARNSSLIMTRTASNYMNFFFSRASNIQFHKGQHQETRNTDQIFISLNIQCLEKSMIRVTMNDGDRIPFISIILSEENISMELEAGDLIGEERGNEYISKNFIRGGIVEVMEVLDNSSLASVLEAQGTGLDIITTRDEIFKVYRVNLTSKIGLFKADFCPVGLVTFEIKLTILGKDYHVGIGSYKNAFIVSKNQITYLDRRNQLQSYDFFPYPKALRIMIACLDETYSQSFAIIDDAVLELSVFKTTDVLNNLAFDEKPEFLRVNYYTLRNSNEVGTLVGIVITLVILIGIFAYLLYRFRTKIVPDSSSIKLIYRNEYYGLTNKEGTELEIRYPNYEYLTVED